MIQNFYIKYRKRKMPEARFELALLSKPHLECGALDQLGHPGFLLLNCNNLIKKL